VAVIVTLAAPFATAVTVTAEPDTETPTTLVFDDAAA
jgi:hypothetical protein